MRPQPLNGSRGKTRARHTPTAAAAPATSGRCHSALSGSTDSAPPDAYAATAAATSR